MIVALTIKSYKIVESFSNDKPLKDNRMHTKFLKCSPSVLGARLFLHDLYYRVPMNIWINKNKNVFIHPTIRSNQYLTNFLQFIERIWQIYEIVPLLGIHVKVCLCHTMRFRVVNYGATKQQNPTFAVQ